MPKLFTLLCSFLALGLLAGGCGGGENSGGGGDQARQQDTGSGSSSKGAKTVEVSLKDIQFQPASVTIPKGATVRWTNDDALGHDVAKSAGPGPEFKSGPTGGMQSGDTFEHRFDRRGTIQYVCTAHANMKGTVTVK